MGTSDAPSLELLLAEVDWIRGLAASLVREADLAEDAVQDAVVAALERWPAAPRNVRAWLAAVVRNAVRKAHRGEGRRRERERWSARAEAEPSALDVVEEFSTRHAVASAVLGLEEPYRETMLLRYYKEESLAEIARRTGVAVSTVDWRLQRGLEKLRRALDGAHEGERGTWVSALVPLLSLSRARGAAPVAVAGGGLWVGVTAVLGAAALVAGMALWTPLPGSEAPALRHERLAVEPALGMAEAAFEPVSPGPAASAREVAAARPVAALASASLEVRVRAGANAAAGVRVRLWPEATGAPAPYPEPRASAGDGQARFERLAPGRYAIELDQGVRSAVQLAPGEHASVPLDLPPGPALEGLVVDGDGEPVAGAEIWLASTRPVEDVETSPVVPFVEGPAARSDANGRFRMESVGAARRIGARAAGFAPSLPHHLAHRRASGETLHVTIPLERPGARLSGTVLDPRGAPLEGVLVLVDADLEFSDELRLPSFAVRTDAAGAFAFEGLARAEAYVSVRAAGREPWRTSVDLAREPDARVEVRLASGVRVHGRVTGERGEPLAGLLVAATERRRLGSSDLQLALATRTAADGSFELCGVPSGSAWLTIDGGPHGSFLEPLLGASGASVRRDVRLEPGSAIRGRVLDAAGAGVEGCSVRAAPQRDWRWRSATTDGDGRFVLPGCEEQTHRLQVVEDGLAVLRRECAPGGADLVLRLADAERPSARLTGTLCDADGRPVRVVGVAATETSTGRARTVRAEGREDGSFSTRGIAPGSYTLALESAGQGTLELDGVFALAPGATLDLETRHLAPTGRVELRLAPGADADDVFVALEDAAGERVQSLRFARASLYLPFSIALPEGRYRAFARAHDAVPWSAAFDVDRRRSAQLELAFERGTPHVLHFVGMRVGQPAGLRLRLRVRIAQGDGTPVASAEFAFQPHDIRFSDRDGALFVETFELAPGAYALEAETSSGLTASGTFTVTAGAAGAPAVFELTGPERPSGSEVRR